MVRSRLTDALIEGAVVSQGGFLDPLPLGEEKGKKAAAAGIYRPIPLRDP